MCSPGLDKIGESEGQITESNHSVRANGWLLGGLHDLQEVKLRCHVLFVYREEQLQVIITELGAGAHVLAQGNDCSTLESNGWILGWVLDNSQK